MLKQLLSAITGGLLLLGAGCQTTIPNIADTLPAPTENTTPTPEQNELRLVVTAAKGSAQLSWNESTAGTWRLLYAARPNPEYPSRAFWYEVLGSKQAATWNEIPTGTRHFRICEFKNKTCVRYSNDVEVEIK